MKEEKNSKPVSTFRSGTVSAAVWNNTVQTEEGEKAVQNITFQRGYKDPETGQWKNTDSYTPASLGNLLAVAMQAIISCNAGETDSGPG
ncbi:MAG: hypothetical protein GY845_08730 [Planctomycetes bacterium]|nr:hypothetical protein [Planctomycetota bacterium]